MREAHRARGVPGVLGIHIEGPFLNPERKGVHDAAKLRPLDAAAIELLTTPTGGRTLVTLGAGDDHAGASSARSPKPASSSPPATRTRPTRRLRAALDAGLRGFTHLFNAMSQLGTREPGAVGAALDDAASWCGLIVDGVHVSIR